MSKNIDEIFKNHFYKFQKEIGKFGELLQIFSINILYNLDKYFGKFRELLRKICTF